MHELHDGKMFGVYYTPHRGREATPWEVC
jgi:hypothetical protein